MTHMLDDPATMTPPQRRREIATILARGVLRLRQCRENTHDSRQSRTASFVKRLRNPARIALMRGQKRALMCPLVNDRETMKELES
jgi:hypothetical protein